ncbi:MAG: aminopeptidase [Trueperaceae bacterium]|nr:aminopeptidase [Trueperaceae bacterium]
MPTFQKNLENLATLALRLGVNLQPGQRLVLIGPVEAVDLLRRIARQAYELGSPHVHVELLDEQMGLIRALHAHDDTLDTVDEERTAMLKAKLERGDAYVRVSGSDPDLMAPADPARVARITKAASVANRPVGDLVQRAHMPWTILAYATPAWARKAFPDLPEAEAVAKLWDAIFAATRADQEDPVAAWEAHLAQLQRANDHLNARGYTALHLKAPGTDLRLGLADTHVWESGGSAALVNGARFVANMPTEEVFTAPHARRVDGVISSSKPLSYQGRLIDRFQLTFRDGEVVGVTAEQGQAALEKLLEIDEGARRLGEVALVPHQSPISQGGLLFYNTLFDENAACHVALGRAYETTMKDGTQRPLEDLQADGFNQSYTHVDFMFGSEALDVDGERPDGTLEPVMRGGAWAF